MKGRKNGGKRKGRAEKGREGRKGGRKGERERGRHGGRGNEREGESTHLSLKCGCF